MEQQKLNDARVTARKINSFMGAGGRESTSLTNTY